MWSWISGLPGALEYLVLIASAVVAVITIYKFAVKPVLAWGKKVNSGMDTLLGYPAVTDPGSGKELKPPTPALALRVDSLEDAMHRLLDLQEGQVGFNARLLELELWRKEHAEWSEQWVKEIQDSNTTWQKEHETLHLMAHETAQELKKTP